ncbi:hypothetical protein DBL07_16275 [Achromobacter mucicolens]|nr:hypothetical protein DBL07_16275 [Achromobacter mucicolens]
MTALLAVHCQIFLSGVSIIDAIVKTSLLGKNKAITDGPRLARPKAPLAQPSALRHAGAAHEQEAI